MQRALAKNFFVWIASTILLLWPLAWNKSPILFNDTIPYLMNGRQVWIALGHITHATHKDEPAPAVAGAPPANADAATTSAAATAAKPHKPIGGRSPYYGAFAWGGRIVGGLGVVAILQAAWTAGMILDALALLGVSQALRRLAVVAVIAATTSLAFFVATIMPDVFAGAGPLAICLIWFRRRQMSRWSLLFWWSSLVASMLFHSAYLLEGFTLVGCLAVVSVRKLRAVASPLVLCGTALAVALVGTAAISVATLRLTGAKVTPIPFLLARTIGDGTAAKVLKQECPQAAWATCRYAKDLPLSGQEFLWGGAKATPWIMLPMDERAAIAKEQNAIVLKALTRYPAEQLTRSVVNGVTQLGALNLAEFEGNEDLKLEVQGLEVASDMDRFQASPVSAHPATLETLAGVWKALYFAAAVLAIVGVAAPKGPAARLTADTRLVLVWLLVAVVFSGLETGSLAGVFGRYGARISWLPMFALCTLACAAIAQRDRGYAAGAAPATAP